jgi:hypothetical protein
LVSHDTNTITTFCDRALILENGLVYAEGAAKAMTVRYFKLLFGGAPGDNDSDDTGENSSAIARAEGMSSNIDPDEMNRSPSVREGFPAMEGDIKSKTGYGSGQTATPN